MNTIYSNQLSSSCNSAEAPELFEEAIRMIGDFWTLRIIDVLANKELRFCEIGRLIAGSNPATLTNRLKRMEEDGLIIRHTETIDKQSVTYCLSPAGKDIVPILQAIKQFTYSHLINR